MPSKASCRPDQRSPEAERYRPLYNTRRWRSIRAHQLAKQPLCERCLPKRVTSATVCHHVDPATKADPERFYDGPFQSLCAECHDGPVQSAERRGYSTEVGADGWPTCSNHPVNRVG